MTNVFGGSEDKSRGGWCTPKWLADIVNLWRPTIDPCSNERSHIVASFTYDGGYSNSRRCSSRRDGLLAGEFWEWPTTAFVNPPYGRNQVRAWVQAWCHTDFCFLLKWSPDTKWFAELWPKCWGAWFPNQRINFEPPPGVESSSNPLPHALYFKNKPTGEFLDALLANGYFVVNDRLQTDPGTRGADRGGTEAAGGAGVVVCTLSGRGCEGVGPRWCKVPPVTGTFRVY